MDKLSAWICPDISEWLSISNNDNSKINKLEKYKNMIKIVIVFI